ncbi:MAG TPA: VapC toxin family PIN domain ribonuclease [Alphaproteobacteria bacterium]|nr:VapC toxin family PIN domain ribonuclease [Alphaproteobacteria bacterium]HAJ47613.1 VapC toxin family PIN domain ribonuclease [Alphaproteobacteria bacterium]
MIVIDASLALDLVLVTRDAKEIMARLNATDRAMAAPEVFDLEILQTIRRLRLSGSIDETRVDAAMGVFLSVPVERYSHAPLRRRIWDLRQNLTAYDAAYFALAEMLDAPLWTRDRKFAAVPGHVARVEIL